MAEELRLDQLFRDGRAIDLHQGGIGPGRKAMNPARDDFERRYILASLRRHRGNVTRTAEALDIERSNLYRKLKSYGIEVERE